MSVREQVGLESADGAVLREGVSGLTDTLLSETRLRLLEGGGGLNGNWCC